MCITHGCICNEELLLVQNPLGEFLWSHLIQELLGSALWRIDLVELRNRRLSELCCLPWSLDDLVSVNNCGCQEVHKAGSSVPVLLDNLKLRMILDEGCVAFSFQEYFVGNHVLQERYVGLHTSDLELAQSSLHYCSCVLESEGMS